MILVTIMILVIWFNFHHAYILLETGVKLTFKFGLNGIQDSGRGGSGGKKVPLPAFPQ